MDNRMIAQQLMHRARYLVDQHASLYRVRAYRRAAETVLGLDEPLETIVDRQGRRGLQGLPGIGDHIARALETLVRTGTLPDTSEVLKPSEVGSPTKPQEERSDSWGTGATECSACGTSSR